MFLGLFIKWLFEWETHIVVLFVFLTYTVTGGWRFLRIVWYTWRRDLKGLTFLIYVSVLLKWYRKTGVTVVTLFDKTTKKNPDKKAFITIDGRSWTFREVNEYSNAVANYFYDQGYRKNDIVAVFMESRPEFVMIWLGLAKIGVISALINFNLKHEALAHCIKVSGARSLIFGSELCEVVKESYHLLPTNIILYISGMYQTNNIQAKHLDNILKDYSKLPPRVTHKTFFNEKLIYIYTSGTTGLPKAAVVTHSRFYYMARSIFHFYKMTADDVIYGTLPLYHSAGGVLGVGNVLISGCTMVIRKKFSASKFWIDCRDHGCTVAQYIGEICRYLLVQPASVNDTNHKIRLMFGNGLRPQIWLEFKNRFSIPQIGEFYGATESNANIVNIDNTPGAIGFQTRIIPSVYPVTLIKVDLITGELIRDKYGRCIRCQPGEPGELVGKIVSGKPLRSFDGYADKEANKKKMARDIFKPGDCYFMSGDILEMDEFGYMYFRDRTGDTYRWKGENVSTSEVEAIISNIIHLTDTTVYGVEIPGTEGRAGMVAVADPNRTLDLQLLSREVKKTLPSYARPVFIRVMSQLNMTSTFKLKKVEYRMEGFNPDIIADDLYYLNVRSNSYDQLNSDVYNGILNGTIRF
ncbi:hypothetical protein HELRODRAFT_109692 [Helobdella robusta]|uniref:long-chain-fatty-acid--CoA ligase n=1 Tax=Helobdella robusta TaxID=6412 RepID=T1EEV7_HELRO|nr:hypothetical protein HELRODRAFT_109692 [Helobdella robusta]ESO09479.1 hypothetical protein HELRODRAFT_109692 [Helobdella robusta]